MPSKYAYARWIVKLAIEQQEGRLRIRPRIVTTTREMRTPEMEQRMREGWSVRPYNLYAITEVGIVGSDCPEHQGIHLNEDLAIFEAVDEADRPVPPGSPGHKLLSLGSVVRTFDGDLDLLESNGFDHAHQVSVRLVEHMPGPRKILLREGRHVGLQLVTQRQPSPRGPKRP